MSLKKVSFYKIASEASNWLTIVIDFNTKDSNGWTAFMAACKNG